MIVVNLALVFYSSIMPMLIIVLFVCVYIYKVYFVLSCVAAFILDSSISCASTAHNVAHVQILNSADIIFEPILLVPSGLDTAASFQNHTVLAPNLKVKLRLWA